MSEEQAEHETDAEPTPGPWELDEITPSGLMKPIFVESGDSTICAMAAFLEPNSHVDPKEALANARLIAAAGTAAHKLPEKYDPVEIVRQTPEIARLIDRLHDETYGEGDPNLDQHFRTPPSKETVDRLIGVLISAEGSVDE